MLLQKKYNILFSLNNDLLLNINANNLSATPVEIAS